MERVEQDVRVGANEAELEQKPNGHVLRLHVGLRVGQLIWKTQICAEKIALVALFANLRALQHVS